MINSSFQLVDSAGNAVTPTGPVTTLTLSGEGEPGHLQPGQTADLLFDRTDPTTGGGQTGSVLISPLIRPGTVSRTFYNHYSWLRTMEDVFQVSRGHDRGRLPAGTVSGGLDGRGHLGFAAQDGLAPFGRDVFTAAGHRGRR
ncbi:alkaline phosphatase family protein [Jatrophihabitans fulvus]